MKKIISLLLTACFVLSVCVVSGFASDGYEVCADIKNISVTMCRDAQSTRNLCWHTTEKTASDVQVVQSELFNGDFTNAVSFSGTTSIFQKEYIHKVTVSSLKAGTKYFYRVGDKANNLWSKCGSFVTDDGDNSFKFIAIADVQASNDNNFAEAAKVMEKAVEFFPGADFYTSLGDYVNDCTSDEWDWFFKNFESENMSMTHVPVAGNHDGNITNKLNIGWFDNMFNVNSPEGSLTVNGAYYSFDYGNAHIAVLNTNDMYPMTVQQTNWLKNDMNNSDAQWKFVFMHRAQYSAGKNIIKPDTIIMRNTLLPIIDELGIDLVMAGHDHMYMRTTQVYGDKRVENVNYVKEIVNGDETTFAVDPKGTCYVLPGTAGTKTYSTRDYVFDSIFPSDCIDTYFSQRDDIKGGCFSTVEISGGDLIYKAYIVNPETGETVNVDNYAIKKTTEGKATPNYENLPTDILSTAGLQVVNFGFRIVQMLYSYIAVIIPKMILNLF